MAKGCEPAFVTAMMAELEGLTHGWSLAGAGGGGFLCLLTKEPNALESIKALLEASPAVDADTLEFFTAQVDTEGLQTTFEDD
jgi:fucokinase